jgi:N-acetyl-anhydromuramyl-L-alanine amidase AmpD
MSAPLQPRTDLRSPNFQDRAIPVEFLLLHYTAGDRERALSHFMSRTRPVSCHLLIDEDGEVLELVDCWNGLARRAAHAGQSRFTLAGREYAGFNEFALGIELVNLNGNLLRFSEAQYAALATCLRHLKALYPALRDPARILGHEHVAGWRGKADPGLLFDWQRLFLDVYPGQPAPDRAAVCPQSLADALRKFLPLVPPGRDDAVRFWHALSATTEAAVALQFSSAAAGSG